MKKKILIIGGKGYIGLKLTKELKKIKRIGKLIIPKKIDVRKYRNIRRHVDTDVRLIINLSGQISKNIKLMKEVIVKGNENIIKVCRNKNILVYYFSTSLVYGYSKKNKKEYSSTTPMDFYSKYKLIAEQKYAKSDINFKIVRLGNIYNGKKNWIGQIIKESFSNQKKLYLTNKNVYRNYIHIDDMIKIFIRMIKKKLKYNIYNLGHENIKLINLIESLGKKLNINIEYYDQKLNLKKIPSQKIDSSRLYSEIKYKPKIKLLGYLFKKFNYEKKFFKK